MRYDEVVVEGEIRHAIRFTVQRTQRAYVAPATHYASSDTDPSLPPMGLRLRMKASYDCSSYSTEAQVVCRALKKHGMIVADNGSNWYLSGQPDPRWDDGALGDLKDIPGDFLAPSLRLEGGPLPDTILPDQAPLAAAIAGFFAARAGLPTIPEAPRVRWIQLRQLRIALPWVARALALPPPELA